MVTKHGRRAASRSIAFSKVFSLFPFRSHLSYQACVLNVYRNLIFSFFLGVSFTLYFPDPSLSHNFPIHCEFLHRCEFLQINKSKFIAFCLLIMLQ